MLEDIPNKNRNVNIEKIIEEEKLPEDTKRIVKRINGVRTKEPGKVLTFYDKVYLVSPSEQKFYRYYRPGLCKELKGVKSNNHMSLNADGIIKVQLAKSKLFFKRINEQKTRHITI